MQKHWSLAAISGGTVTLSPHNMITVICIYNDIHVCITMYTCIMYLYYIHFILKLCVYRRFFNRSPHKTDPANHLLN